MNNALYIQGIGFIAVAISLCIFQTNKRKNMLILGTTAAFFYAAHFFLLGAMTGAAMNVVGGIRSYVYYRITPSRKNVWVLILFLAIAAGATALTWQGSISLLPLIGIGTGSIAFWQKNPTYIRRWAMIASPAWFTYNYISGSYAGMFIEIVMLSSNLVGQYRFDFSRSRRTPRLSRARA